METLYIVVIVALSVVSLLQSRYIKELKSGLSDSHRVVHHSENVIELLNDKIEKLEIELDKAWDKA